MFDQPDDNPETEAGLSSQRSASLDEEFREAILNQLARGGVLHACVEIEIRALGEASDGRRVYAGMLRLVRWEQVSAMRLLLGLPLLQAMIRRSVRNSWLGEVAHFGGLWLHPSGQFEGGAAMADLRGMILALEQTRGRSHGMQPEVEHSVWSVPQELMVPDGTR